MSAAAPTRFSQLLRKKIALVSPAASPAALTIWDHPRLPAFYPDLLFVGHCIIRASVPLMQAAREQAMLRATADPVCAALAQYLADHIDEEMHHDEWLLQDLAELGISPEELLARMPPASVAQLVGAQYYWILHYHPVALLGYIAVLEGTPLSEDELERAIAASGLPRQAFRTLLKHAKLDPHHCDDLDRLLDRLALSPSQSGLVGSSAMLTAALLDQAFDEVLPPGLRSCVPELQCNSSVHSRP